MVAVAERPRNAGLRLARINAVLNSLVAVWALVVMAAAYEESPRNVSMTFCVISVLVLGAISGCAWIAVRAVRRGWDATAIVALEFPGLCFLTLLAVGVAVLLVFGPV